MTTAPDAEQFQELRPLLFSIAYQMLGSATEAEDAIQDAYVRYAVLPRAEVRSPRQYLSTVVSRLCLDRLKSARAKREQYVGPWLPEPVVTSGAGEDPLRGVERREAVSLAFLCLMESLTPAERAVFLLREVFEYPYDEIAAVLEMTSAACRQLFHRARERVRQHRPRFTAAPDRQREFIDRFLSAAQAGDIGSFENLLAEDVVYRSDGGGKASAARKPVHGREAVARLLYALTRQAPARGDFSLTIEEINGEPALIVWLGEQLDSIVSFHLDEERIAGIDAIRNPDKLGFARSQLHARPIPAPEAGRGPTRNELDARQEDSPAQ